MNFPFASTIKLKYLGVIAYLIAITAILLCFIVASDIIPTQNNFALSDFGVEQRTQFIFNGSLIISGLLNLIYALYYFSNYRIRLKNLVVGIFVISSAALIGIGLIPYSIDYELHTLSALVYFFSFALFFIVCGLFFEAKRDFGKILTTLGIVQLILVILFVGFHLPYGLGQIIQLGFAGTFYFGLLKINIQNK